MNMKMEKYIKFIKLILLLTVFANTSCYAVTLESSGSTTSKGDDGENYTVKFFGNLILSKDGLVNNSLIQGKGRKLLDNDMLASSGEINKIDGNMLAVTIDDKITKYELVESTKICRDKQAAPITAFKEGEMVTVINKLNENIALSIKNGPMLFKAGGFPMKPQEYNCD